MSLLGRLVCALVVAVVAGIFIVYLLGPVLALLQVPIALVVAVFLEHWGWVLAIALGVWYFFSGSTWPASLWRRV